MNSTNTLFTGIFGAFVLSCGMMVLLPNSQIGSLNPSVGEWDGSKLSADSTYPSERQPIGRGSYVSHGCFYCHTQQVRDPQYGPDLERGWGVRRTVARDYIFEEVPLLGSMRLGPDFANYGNPAWRNEPPDDPKPKPVKRDAAWIYKHLYNPTILEKRSICPPMTGLFDRQEIGETPSPYAAYSEGKYEWIPSAEARELAEYLLSQNRSFVLGKEAPIVAPPKEEKK